MRFLTAELVRVADATGEHYRPMVLTAGLVGLRIGELAGLRIDNVKRLKRMIYVREQFEVEGKATGRPRESTLQRRGRVGPGLPRTNRTGRSRCTVAERLCRLPVRA
jgi:integrase